MKISAEQFDRIKNSVIKEVVQSLPAHLKSKTDNLIFETRDRPGKDDITEPDDYKSLMGLYQGVPHNERGVFDNYTGPDVITLFRLNITAACRNESELREELLLTVIHELGHMFGLDEEDLEKMGFN